jgi:hypothetical protein
MPSKTSIGVLLVLLACGGISTVGCGDRKGLGEQQSGEAGSGAAGTTGVAGTGESAAGSTGAAGTSGVAGTTGAAGAFGVAGTTGAAGTGFYPGTIGDPGDVMLTPVSGDWSKLLPTPGCGRPPGVALGAYVRGTIPTKGAKPPGCADSRCGEWSYDREFYVRLPPEYDASKAYPIVFEGPGCGGKGNQLYNNPPLGQLAIRVGLTPPPNDIGHATNPNQGCFDDKEGDDSVDWVFYERLYDVLAAQFCFDRNRVFAAGNSSGARMANELGCKYAGDVLRPVRGVMPNSAGLPFEPMYRPTCTSKPLAGIWINSVENQTNPFTETVRAIDRAITVNGCPAGTTYANAQFDLFPIGGESVCKRMKGCLGDVPLVVCPLPGNQSHGSNDNIVNPGWVAFLKLFTPTP